MQASPDAPPLDLSRDVVEASRQLPVLVDFWAPWCGPCRTLGPLLERLEAEAGGQWRLVKINTDEHPGLMAQFGIRGIPAVKLFVDGKTTAEFTGALPEFVLRKWLDEHLPSEARAHYDAGLAAWDSGDRDAARQSFEAALAAGAETAPWAESARARLARLVVFDDADRARRLVDGLHAPEAEAVRHVADLLDRDADALPEGDARDRYAEAIAAVQSGDLDAALAAFVDVVQRDRAYDDDGARRSAVALFQTLGEGHAVTQKHRPTFNRSLY